MSQLETPALRHRLNDDALDVIFRTARTYSGWLEKPVSDETLHELYEEQASAASHKNEDHKRRSPSQARTSFSAHFRARVLGAVALLLPSSAGAGTGRGLRLHWLAPTSSGRKAGEACHP